ncbi:hypothetical protein TRVL_00435 [Trypanosoma vivax]|nr:hypothetical protein TRVL_00435 [Trypanosoma vivax]
MWLNSVILRETALYVDARRWCLSSVQSESERISGAEENCPSDVAEFTTSAAKGLDPRETGGTDAMVPSTQRRLGRVTQATGLRPLFQGMTQDVWIPALYLQNG